MNTKIAVLILVIVVAIGGLGAYVISKQKKAPQPNTKQVVEIKEVQPVQQPEEQQVLQEEESFPVDIATMIIPADAAGTVSKLDPAFLIIDKEDGSALQFSISKNTRFFRGDGLEKKQISITNLKEGLDIALKINIQTGEILDVFIVE